MDSYITDRLAEKLTKRFDGIVKKIDDAYFPAPDLTRKTWKMMNPQSPNDQSKMNNFIQKYGKPRVVDWAIEQNQRDLEER